MDRRTVRIIAIVMMLAALTAAPLAASAYSVYDGTVSTTYITIFRDIAAKLPIDSDYVFFRAGQYEYVMAAGDLNYSNQHFSGAGSALTIYSLTTNSNYNSTYNYSVTEADTFSLDAGDALIYSNLGEYPDLYERSDYLEVTTVLILAIGVCCYLIRSVFSWVLRKRS